MCHTNALQVAADFRIPGRHCWPDFVRAGFVLQRASWTNSSADEVSDMWYDHAHLIVALIHVRDLAVYVIALVTACACALLMLGAVIGCAAYAASVLLVQIKGALIEAYETMKGRT